MTTPPTPQPGPGPAAPEPAPDPAENLEVVREDHVRRDGRGQIPEPPDAEPEPGQTPQPPGD